MLYPEIIQAKQTKRKNEKTWRASGLVVHKDIFLQSRDHLSSLITTAKKEHYVSHFNDCSGNQALIFKRAEKLLHRKGETALPKHKDIQSLVDEFNIFFTTKISNIRQLLDERTPSIEIENDMVFEGSKLTEFDPTTEEETIKIIKKASKATCDLDPLPTKLICDEVLKCLAPVLTKIVNISFSTGVFPEN